MEISFFKYGQSRNATLGHTLHCRGVLPLTVLLVVGHIQEVSDRPGVGGGEHGSPPQRLHLTRTDGLLRKVLLKRRPSRYTFHHQKSKRYCNIVLQSLSGPQKI